jgi:integrase
MRALRFYEAHRLLSNARRFDSSAFVCPSIFDPLDPLPEYTYHKAWKRALERDNVQHVGTHGIRHRAATDVAKQRHLRSFTPRLFAFLD